MKKFKPMKKDELLRSLSPEIQKLFDDLNQLKKELSLHFKAKLNRVLPFSEMLFDRWDKAKSLSFGEGTSVYDDVLIFGNVTVGKNTWVGPHVILDGSGGLHIGDNCSISAGVQVYSHNTVQWAVSAGKESYEYKATKIGNNCFIGPQTIIQNGVTVGDNCVVGANSFVNKDIPVKTIFGGSPAKMLGRIEIDNNGKVELVYLN
jgi:acetyltransferase-like isoleucine patch superfamily enzyme